MTLKDANAYVAISIHAPHTGRDLAERETLTSSAISIHAPHTGRDRQSAGDYLPDGYFNPRAPYGARPMRYQEWTRGKKISIHAPHTGRDPNGSSRTAPTLTNFNPRAPYGARQDREGVQMSDMTFQSTRPIRGATPVSSSTRLRQLISIHAPHTGRDANE